MGSWVLAGVVGVALLVLVLVALQHGEIDTGDEGPEAGPAPDGTAADTAPTPAAVGPPRFRLTWQGYDPDQVDAYVARITAAYARLWTAHQDLQADRGWSAGRPLAPGDARTPVRAADPPPHPPAPDRADASESGPVIVPKVRAEPAARPPDPGTDPDGG